MSVFWLILRTGRKPSRVVYPCQRAAIGNIHVFLLVLYLPLLNLVKEFRKRGHRVSNCTLKAIILLSPLIFSLAFAAFSNNQVSSINISRAFSLALNPQEALGSENSSDLFFVQNASQADGNLDAGLSTLLYLMESHDLHFFNTSDHLDGLIGKNDVVILKVNCQWPERGGTNTDLIKSLVEKILNHPEDFTGEIVIADNGQGRGSLDWTESNAFNHSQSIQDVADMFSSSKISTFLWDTIRRETEEYDGGQFSDGYVFNSTADPVVSLCVSYPKFRTTKGTYISFGKGIWDNTTSSYDSSRLKVINIPVLKSHQNYGVTGCIKHYMGVVHQQFYPANRNAHTAIARGAMGVVMAETRFPTLNILDAVWINPNPMESGASVGPSTPYETASFLNIIGASLDPVALDYWASKHILIPTAIYNNHTEYSSIDPDYELGGVYGWFHIYLNRSKNLLKERGFQITMSETEMNVWISSAGPVHNLDSGLSYATIQRAIDANVTFDRHTILVDSGMYFEHLIVDKAVSIKGEDKNSTIIDGEGTGSVISITSNNVTITGFTIQNSGHTISSTVPDAGINISPSTNCNISENRLTDNYVGIFTRPSVKGCISRNTIEGNHIGVDVNNQSTYNIIFGNNLHNNNVSIHIYYANLNTFFENNLANSPIGAAILHSQNNEFYHNTFLNNTKQISAHNYSVNLWDDGLEGNYWNDYSGWDNDDNGIGDTSYVINANNTDNFPLMGPFNSFSTSLGKAVNIISNSAVEGFEYALDSTIRFYISNSTSNQYVGFCRVTIPKDLLTPPYTVIIDDGLVDMLLFNDSIEDNGTHRWIYFNYEHSTHEIDIIPESPLITLLPLLIIATSLTTLVYKKFNKHSLKSMGT